MPIIGLMTDFGTSDHYVGTMKGIIYGINPKATVVDITHEIGSQDVLHGAFVLRQVLPYFPANTIFVAVIDPTVGTDRRILAGRYSDRIILAPDNGLLTLVHRDADLQEIRVVENRQLFAGTLTPTFHGRDIFAPVAAHLSRGTTFDSVGPVADHIEILELKPPTRHTDGTIDGEITLIDKFGNLITNISMVDLSAARAGSRSYNIFVKDQLIGPVRTTYADAAVGDAVAIIGGSQMLEIAVNKGSAAKVLGVKRGDPVHLR